MYSRNVNGKELSFGVSGKLIMNVLVMYDRQTETLWSQLLGEAVEGALTGSKLTYLPAWQTTWVDWKARYPDTLAIDKGYSGNLDPYERYYLDPRAGVLGHDHLDQRLKVKQFVIGVEQNGEAAAYPFSILNDQAVVNDILGGIPILVVFNAETGTGVVFEGQVGDHRLTFSTAEEQILVDAETGTLWDGLTGRAIEGPLSGARLNRIKSTSAFWFGWKDWYPDTIVFGIDDE